MMSLVDSASFFLGKKNLKTCVSLLQLTLKNRLYLLMILEVANNDQISPSHSSHNAYVCVKLSPRSVEYVFHVLSVFLVVCLNNFYFGIDVYIMHLIKLYQVF